ncbi:MAG: glycogen debranching N-terminal domain-containing protein [Terriglobia bacterium]
MNAVILKAGGIFLLAKRDASVPLGGKHGLGLYYHDCRFLDGYILKVGDVEPEGFGSRCRAILPGHLRTDQS